MSRARHDPAGAYKPPRLTSEQLTAWWEQLPVGREGARTAEALGVAWGWIADPSDMRRVESVRRLFREYAEQATFAGLVFSAGNAGYWRPNGPQDARAIRLELGRLESQIARSAARVRQAIANVDAYAAGGALVQAPLPWGVLSAEEAAGRVEDQA